MQLERFKKYQLFPCYNLFPGFQLSEMFFFLFDFQLSIIEPIKRDIIEARDAINMGDYPRAIEFLGKAIEVIIIILSIISYCLCYRSKLYPG